MADFAESYRAYREAKARLDLDMAIAPEHYGEVGAVEFERLNDEHVEAIDRLLMTPATTADEVAIKIDVVVAEGIHDNWHLAGPIMALLRCDASRVLLGRPI